MKFKVTMPASWQDLDDAKLRYVFFLLSQQLPIKMVQTYCFFRWSGIKVLHRFGEGWSVRFNKKTGLLTAGQVADAIHALDWLDEFPAVPVRLAKISGRRPIGATLADDHFPGWKGAKREKHRFTFGKYLFCENLYQRFLDSKDSALLEEMAKYLYDSEKIRLTEPERISIFYWWASLKGMFGRVFCNFLVPAGESAKRPSGSALAQMLSEATNAQVRALSGGDITKNKIVLDMDVWSAMQELDAKAKESKDLERKYGKG